MFLIAAMRHVPASRLNTIVVQRFCVLPAMLYQPSAIATSGDTNRRAWTSMLRSPGFCLVDSAVPVTTAGRPRRHSPAVVYWSASVVKSDSMAF